MNHMMVTCITYDLYLSEKVIPPLQIFVKTKEERLKNQQREYEAQMQYRQHLQVSSCHQTSKLCTNCCNHVNQQYSQTQYLQLLTANSLWLFCQPGFVVCLSSVDTLGGGASAIYAYGHTGQKPLNQLGFFGSINAYTT